MAKVIEVRRADSYAEQIGSISTKSELYFYYDTEKTLAQVQADLRDWCLAHARDFGNRPMAQVSISQEDGSLGNVWTATVEWSTRPKKQNQNQTYPQQPGCQQESFNSIGGTAHVTQGYYETRYYVDEEIGYPPDLNGGIGWNGDRFEGVDIVSPTFEFSLSHKYPYDTISPTIRNNWLSLVGCVNSDTFCSFPPGEVLYCGFSGGTSTEYDGELITIDGIIYQRAKNYYNITHNFKCSPNAPAMEIAGTTIEKYGWDYVWVLRSKYDDEDTGQTVEKPVGVYVDQVYKYAEFDGVF